MATHFSILAWEIPWMEEPGGLQSMGSQKESDMSQSLINNVDYVCVYVCVFLIGSVSLENTADTPGLKNPSEKAFLSFMFFTWMQTAWGMGSHTDTATLACLSKKRLGVKQGN